MTQASQDPWDEDFAWSDLSEAEFDDAIVTTLYQIDGDRLRAMISDRPIDPNRRVGTHDGGVPLLHIALDAEWERGIHDESYVCLGECLVALIEVGADPTVSYLGRSVLDELRRQEGYAAMLREVESAMRRRGGE